jgi:hypothetical protein
MSALSTKPSLPTETAPLQRRGLYDAWWTVAAAALGVCVALTGSLWLSMHLTVDAPLHTAALFVHLASLVLGFGAVLSADYSALVWLTGRSTLREMLNTANRLHVPIWTGLAGLVASGAMLHPDLDSTLTRIKLAMVLVLSLNGLQAGLLTKRMARQGPDRLPRRLLTRAAATALVSQVCWWGAVVIGFHNTPH